MEWGVLRGSLGDAVLHTGAIVDRLAGGWRPVARARGDKLELEIEGVVGHGRRGPYDNEGLRGAAELGWEREEGGCETHLTNALVLLALGCSVVGERVAPCGVHHGLVGEGGWGVRGRVRLGFWETVSVSVFVFFKDAEGDVGREEAGEGGEHAALDVSDGLRASTTGCAAEDSLRNQTTLRFRSVF